MDRINLYKIYNYRKQCGDKFNFDNVTYDELYNLFENASDSQIADLYEVSKYKVTKKRNDFGIKQFDIVWAHVVEDMEKKGLI